MFVRLSKCFLQDSFWKFHDFLDEVRESSNVKYNGAGFFEERKGFSDCKGPKWGYSSSLINQLVGFYGFFYMRLHQH